MKVFYTDLSKKSDQFKLGTNLLKLAIALFILLGIVLIGSTAIFERGSVEIKIGFYISMVIMIMFFIVFIGGMIISRVKITGMEDLRVFVQNNEDLYVIDKNGIEDDHFATFRLSMIDGGGALSILCAIVDMLSYNKERKEKINNARNEEEIIKSLDSYKHNKIKSIKIEKDTGTTIVMVIRTMDGSRRKISIGNNYYNYEELFSVIRNFGGK